MTTRRESDREARPTVTLVRRGVVFEVAGEQTVLEAALAAGIDVPYACAVGGCMACKTRLIAGEVAMPGRHGLSPAARERGWILLCRARALGPIILDA